MLIWAERIICSKVCDAKHSLPATMTTTTTTVVAAAAAAKQHHMISHTMGSIRKAAAAAAAAALSHLQQSSASVATLTSNLPQYITNGGTPDSLPSLSLHHHHPVSPLRPQHTTTEHLSPLCTRP